MTDTKVALVFGGSRGIGAATVQALRCDAFDVAWTYTSTTPEGTARGLALRADVCDPQEVAAAFEHVHDTFRTMPHCVVVNAGINVPPAPIAEVDPAVFARVMHVNLFGAFNVLQAAARNCLEGGTIVAVSTSLVRYALPGSGPYIATKGALECLVRSLQKELAPKRVRVNAVAPGPVDTDLFRAGKTEEAIRRSAALSPFDRVGQPEEVAAVIAFLASERSSWVAGQIVMPNGGLV